MDLRNAGTVSVGPLIQMVALSNYFFETTKNDPMHIPQHYHFLVLSVFTAAAKGCAPISNCSLGYYLLSKET